MEAKTQFDAIWGLIRGEVSNVDKLAGGGGNCDIIVRKCHKRAANRKRERRVHINAFHDELRRDQNSF